ncbi:mucin-12 isoform X1 [Esox lucius]|uniref:Ig-like domain-containing protein n=1 Tax=Esox lucius TaxID=8010 RepID=A0A6Q2ZEU4_ESOLU|nr:mucin-12 isoform X1 [Esox lucius]
MQTQRGAGVLVMAVSRWMLYTAVLLPVQGSPTLPDCPEPCYCHKGPMLNCSSVGLSLGQKHIPSTVTDLDLSHNLLNSFSPLWPSWGLKNLWIGHNSLIHLSLCVERTWGKLRGTALSHSRGKCVSWAPALQLLSAENNQLERIPEGIAGCQFLLVLQLSHNRISDLRSGDLSRSPRLREIHLQHNRISSLNPLALRDLPEIRVLDLSFNMLTTIPPSAYLALRNLNALVEVSGNKWRCDCNLRSLRRWMIYDRDMDQQQSWKGVVCSHPSVHSGRDLLHLEDSDLTCSTAENRAGLHQDVTVDEGTDILLPCSSPNQDSTWWTPNGQVPGSQNGLLISDIAEKDTGLYVCVSGPDEETVSVFDLHVHKTPRKTRGTRSLYVEQLQMNPELGRLQRGGQKTDLQRATQRTQSELDLAVCLSVFITLVVAFILGALARPLLDVLWGRYCKCCECTRKSPIEAQSVTSAGRGPHDNNAYSDEEEGEEVGTHRERRVTFSGHPSELRDQNSVPYYDTMATGRQGNQAGEYGASYNNFNERDTFHTSLEVNRPPDSVSSGSSQQDNQVETDTHSGDPSNVSLRKPPGGANPVHTDDVEFEPIPDPDEWQRSRSLSVSSHSDQERSDRGQDIDCPTKNLAQNNPQESHFTLKEGDTTKQSLDFPMVKVINSGSVDEISKYTIESSIDWKHIMAEANLLDPELWNDSGESFEFPDSIRSASARSSNKDLYGSALVDQLRKESEQARNEKLLAKDQRENDKSGSSSSCDCGNEPTEYAVNAQIDEVKEVFPDSVLTHDSCPDPAANLYFQQDVKEGVCVGELRMEVRCSPVFSQHSSSDSGDEPTTYTVNGSSEEECDQAQKDLSLSLRYRNVSFAPRKALSIEISKEGIQYMPEPEANKEPLTHPSVPSDRAWVGDPPVPVHIPRFGKRLDIQPPRGAKSVTHKKSPLFESSSSSEREEETIENSVKLNREVPDVLHKDSFLNLGDINVSVAPRKAVSIGLSKDGFQYQPEMETKSSSLNLSSHTAITPKDQLPQYSLPEGTMAEESPVYIPSFRRHLDIQSPNEIPPPTACLPRPAGSSSSSSESEDDTAIKQKRQEENAKVLDSSFSLAGIDVSFSPRKTLNIGFSKEGIHYQSEPNSTGVALTSESVIGIKENLPKSSIPSDGTREEESPVPVYIPRLRRRLDIQSPQDTPPAIPQTPPPSESLYSSSESEDETTRNRKGEQKAKIPNSSFSLAGIDVSLAPRKALNIGISEDGIQYQSDSDHQGTTPAAPSSPGPAGSTSPSSESEDETEMYQRKEERETKVPESSFSLSCLDVSFAPRKALNIGFSEDGIQYQPGPETKSTGLDLTTQFAINAKVPLTQPSLSSERLQVGGPPVPVHIPRFGKRLDIQPPRGAKSVTHKKSPLFESSSSSEREEETIENSVKLNREVPDVLHKDSFLSLGDINVSVAPRKAVSIGLSKDGFQYQPEMETKSSSLNLSSHTAITPKDQLPQYSLPEGTMAEESPVYIPSFRRHLDIQSPNEIPPPSACLPRPAGSSSSSSESEDDTAIKQKRQEENAMVLDSSFSLAGIDVSFSPRKTLNIGFSKEGIHYQSEPNSTGVALTSESVIGIKENLPKSSIPSDGTREEESPVPVYIPRLRRRLDIQSPQDTPPAIPQTPPPSESLYSSSESEDETTRNRKGEQKAKIPNSSFSLAGIDVSLAPRKALNIGISEDGIQYQSDSDHQGTTPAAPSSPGPAGSTSPSSESEDETEMYQRKEERETKVPESSFSLSGLDISFAPRKALNIGFSKENSYLPHPEAESRLSDQGLTSQTAINTKYEGFKDTKILPQVFLPKTSFSSSSYGKTADGATTQLFYVPQHRKRLDIQPPQNAPPAAPQTPPPSGSSSSSIFHGNETAMPEKKEEDEARLPDVTYNHPSLSPGDTSINISFAKKKELNIGFAKEHLQSQSTTSKGGAFQEDAKQVPKLSLPKTSLSSTAFSESARAEELTLPPTKSSSSSGESGNEPTEPTKKPGRDIPDFSLSPGETPIKVSFTPRKALNIGLYNSTSTTDEVDRKTKEEDRRNRPGLGGLKVLSEMRQWDTMDSSTDVAFSQRRALNIKFDALDNSTDEVAQRVRTDYSSPIQGYIDRKEGGLEEVTNLTPKVSLPKTSRFFSTPTPSNEARLIQSPLQIPRQRRRLVVDIQPPLAPPAAQGTPPAFPEGDEAAGSGWRSRGEQGKAVDGFGFTTQAEKGEKHYMGLLTAKPFGSARQYQRSVASETFRTTRHSAISEREGPEKGTSTSDATLHFETHREGSEA